jgi:hypothetical protein
LNIANQTREIASLRRRMSRGRILSGAEIDDQAPVYVITLTGGPFTATRHPPGVAAPNGNVLTLTVDAATHRITDVGYVDTEPELNQLGPARVDLAGVQ